MALLSRLVGPYRDGLTGVDRRAYAVVTMTLLSVGARMGVYTFLGIHLTRDVGLTLSVVGIGYLVENVLRGLLAPFAGALSDRIGRRAVLLASAAASAVVLPAFLLVATPGALFVWSALLGASQAGLWPATAALLLDLTPPSARQAILGLNYTALSVGYTLGVAPAGLLLRYGFGALAIASGTAYVAVVVLLAITLRRPLPSTREGVPRRSLLADLTQAPRDPAFVLLAAFGIIFPIGIGLIATVAPLYASAAGLSEGAIGVALGANGILLALGSLPVAAWLGRRGPYRYLPLSALLLAGSYAVLLPGGTFVPILLAGVVFTAGELIFASALPAAVAGLAPRGLRGAYQGAWALVHSVGFGAAVFLTGLLTPTLGWRGTWVVWIGVTLAAGAGLALARARFRRLADARATAPVPTEKSAEHATG